VQHAVETKRQSFFIKDWVITWASLVHHWQTFCISATFPLWQDIYEAEIRRRAVPPVKDTPTVVSTLKEAALGASALVEQALTR